MISILIKRLKIRLSQILIKVFDSRLSKFFNLKYQKCFIHQYNFQNSNLQNNNLQNNNLWKYNLFLKFYDLYRWWWSEYSTFDKRLISLHFDLKCIISAVLNNLQSISQVFPIKIKVNRYLFCSIIFWDILKGWRRGQQRLDINLAMVYT